MIGNQLLLSIVIPTKNRYEYLETALDALLVCRSDQFEVIVQDNSDDNSRCLEYLERISDHRVHYGHVPGWVSVVENCDLGVSRAAGKYICMLGDDDGILLENSLAVLSAIESNAVDAIVTNRVVYSWPDSSHAIWSGMEGRFHLPVFTSSITLLPVEGELRKVLAAGAAFGVNNLPCVYHGFVRKQVLDALRAETGTCFPGPSPDMANAIGLTKFVRTCLHIDAPLVISGHGGKSTGGQGARRQHRGSIERTAHLPKETAAEWSKEVPYFWSGPTIYSESASKALARTRRSAMYPINYNTLYASCLVYEPATWREVLVAAFAGKSAPGAVSRFVAILFRCVVLLFKRALNLLANIQKYKFRKDQWHSAGDVGEVAAIVNARCSTLRESLQQSLSRLDLWRLPDGLRGAMTEREK